MAFIYMESLIIIVLSAVLCLRLNNKRVASYIATIQFRNLSAYTVYSLYINKSNNYTEVSVATYLGIYSCKAVGSSIASTIMTL